MEFYNAPCVGVSLKCVYIIVFVLFLMHLFLAALGLLAARAHFWLQRVAGAALPPPCTGFSCCRTGALKLQPRGFHCCSAWGISPDQGSNPCALHPQAHSYPPYYQGSPDLSFLKKLSSTLF